MSLRKPPVKAIFALHLPKEGGKCRWCGKPITGSKGDILKRCRWHAECLHDFKIIAWPQYARKEVSKRDKGICVDCGADERLSGAWEVEHNIPLWKIATIEPIARLAYFRLDALLTRCTPCHKVKTAAEAAERAHLKRLSKPKHLGIKAKSRPMDGSRKSPWKKLMSGGVVRR